MKKFFLTPPDYAEHKESTEELLRDWDKVRCARCGKEISMLNASTINNGQNFVCKDLNCGI